MGNLFSREKVVTEYVYIITTGDKRLFKIGRTKNDVAKRLKQLQTGNPDKLHIYFAIPTADSAALEASLHRKYKEYRILGGEWFKISEAEVKKIIKTYENYKRQSGNSVVRDQTIYEKKYVAHASSWFWRILGY